MPTSEFTLTSPISLPMQGGRPLLGLTIAWHPDTGRIGEQFIVTGTGPLELSRHLPLFKRPDSEALSLGYSGVSRAPLRIEQNEDGSIIITPPDSRMAVELHGAVIDAATTLSTQQIEAGVILSLGRAVFLCLHWMRCLPQANAVDGFLGVGNAAIRARTLIRQAAATDASVLLLGETGTGKEVAARAIHALSRRAAASMVSVNMAALNESLAAADLFGAARGAYTGAQTARAGLFAEAQGSTLFLDEIGNAPAAVQPMLLRVLETGDYRPLGATRDQQSSARLIAATDQDLYGGGFNAALLRRLESFIIHLPPLRARREDIGLLIAHLLPASDAPPLPAALVTQLLCYDWPGNVRQLTHVIKRVLLALRMGELPQLAELVDLKALTYTSSSASNIHAAGSQAPRRKLADISANDILQAMNDNDWYIQGAAQTLGVSRPSMYKLLESHPTIRPATAIAPSEITDALDASAQDIEECAARLQTPTEALRRHLRTLKLLN
jgi:two-component system nitrogen regulation response regulator GlnG